MHLPAVVDADHHHLNLVIGAVKRVRAGRLGAPLKTIAQMGPPVAVASHESLSSSA
jgi:hypothetical protein